MGKYLDSSGITHLWSKIKTYIASLGYTSNVGTVTGITMNNTSYSPVNGNVNIGTVVTDVSDWSQTTTTALDYIKNKPDITQVNSPTKTITISGVSNTIVVGDTASIGRNKSKIEIGSNGGDNDTISLTTSGSDGGVYVSTDTQKFYYNNKEVATKNDIPTISTDIISDGIDDTKTASPKAVKTFVEGKHYLTSSALNGYVQTSNISGLIKNDGTIDTSSYITSSSLSNYVEKSQTAGLLKNDGTVDTNIYLTSETEPDFNGSAAATITSSDITSWNGKQNALVFNTTYDASSNKVATMNDISTITFRLW